MLLGFLIPGFDSWMASLDLPWVGREPPAIKGDSQAGQDSPQLTDELLGFKGTLEVLQQYSPCLWWQWLEHEVPLPLERGRKSRKHCVLCFEC